MTQPTPDSAPPQDTNSPWSQFTPAPGSQSSPPVAVDPSVGAAAEPGPAAASGYSAPSAPGAPAPQGAATGGPAERPQRANFFRAMVDFRFEHFITIQFSSILYALAWLVALLMWGWMILSSIFLGLFIGEITWSGGSSFSPWPLLLALFLGWIPSVISLVAMRLALEFTVAIVRTAENTGDLVRRAPQS